MAEQKIVIRLNKASNVLPPEMPAKIEEVHSWNIPRVVASLFILGSLLFWLFRGISSTTGESEDVGVLAEKPAIVHDQLNDNKSKLSGEMNAKVSDVPTWMNASERSLGLQSGVTRSQFTHAVRNNEPVDTVSSPVRVSSEKAMTLSFFTKVEGMAGEVIRHRWQHDGRVVAEIKFDVESNSYPVYSSKYLNDTMLGRWQVVVLNNADVELKSEEIVVVEK